MARLLLLYNPFARIAPNPELLQNLQRVFTRSGFAVEAYGTRAKGDLTWRAAQAVGQGYDRVVACGGDGTLREVAQGLVGSEMPMGMIPLGTANILAHEVELPVQSPLRCAEIAAAGQARWVTAGEVNQETFLFCASAGIDASAVAGVNHATKASLGPMAYVLSGARALCKPAETLGLQVEGESPLEVAQVWALKSCLYSQGWLRLSKKASLFHSTLRLVAIRPPLRGRLPVLLPMALAGALESGPGIVARDVDSFRLLSPEGVAVQADGDCLTALPATFRAKPRSLRLVLPV